VIADAPFLGLYVPPFPPDGDALDEVERRLGARAEVVLWYQAWGSVHAPFRREWVDAVLSRGRIPLLTWEPWRLPGDLESGAAPEAQPAFALARILAGDHDAYLDAFALELAALDTEVWLRPLHEMNGCWYPWAGTVNGNHPHEFVRVWHHLRDRVRAAGAHRVRWVFSPHAGSYPDTVANGVEAYYPGDDAVDLVGIDAYNWSGVTEGVPWTSLASLVAPTLDRVRRVSGRPVFVAETACPPDPRRAAWIESAWDFVRRERLRGLVWFHADKECDWRVADDPNAARALAGGVASSFEPRSRG
jgi:hypothetical protein